MKTPAQVALRFLIQLGVVVIPKSVHRERMEDIRGLDTGESLFFSHTDPERVEWFMTMMNEQKKKGRLPQRHGGAL